MGFYVRHLSFYKYAQLESPSKFGWRLKQILARHQALGRVLVAPEVSR